MSRSFRHSRITGITTAHAEKLYKRQYNKRIRRAVRSGSHLTNKELLLLMGDPWCGPKDGKSHFYGKRYDEIWKKLKRK